MTCFLSHRPAALKWRDGFFFRDVVPAEVLCVFVEAADNESVRQVVIWLFDGVRAARLAGRVAIVMFSFTVDRSGLAFHDLNAVTRAAILNACRARKHSYSASVREDR